MPNSLNTCFRRCCLDYCWAEKDEKVWDGHTESITPYSVTERWSVLRMDMYIQADIHTRYVHRYIHTYGDTHTERRMYIYTYGDTHTYVQTDSDPYIPSWLGPTVRKLRVMFQRSQPSTRKITGILMYIRGAPLIGFTPHDLPRDSIKSNPNKNGITIKQRRDRTSPVNSQSPFPNSLFPFSVSLFPSPVSPCGTRDTAAQKRHQE
jgi:hypothetical protein